MRHVPRSAVWPVFPSLALFVSSPQPKNLMANRSLADRFQMIQTTQTKHAQEDRLMSMSFEEVGQLTIRFGESKVGQQFSEVVKEDQKYCQWFIRKFAESSKPEHREFLHYINLYVERKELELNGLDQAAPKAKAKPPTKTQAGMAHGSQSNGPSMIDLDPEDETWDQISAQGLITENRNSQRLDVIEDALSQIMNQLQVLTQVTQSPSLA